MAANRERGEADVTIDGKTYTLICNTNAVIMLEAFFSSPSREVTWDQILGKVLAGSIRHNVGIVWASLQKYHAREFETMASVSDLIDRAGGLIAFARQIASLVESAKPDEKDVEAIGAKKARPRKAGSRGIGTRSTGTRGESA